MVPKESSELVSIEEYLKKAIEKHLPNLAKMKNGNLHSLVVSLVEKPLVQIVMEKTAGNQTDAARILGINRNTLRAKIKAYGVKQKKPAASAAAKK